MAIDDYESAGSIIYTDAFRALLPGLLIGFMFLAVAFASKSAADSEQRRFEGSLTSRSAVPENLREEISLNEGVTEASLIQTNSAKATESGLRKLNDPEAAAGLERVTIEIEVARASEAWSSDDELPMELLELLSRRASPLQLELTLRVAPSNADIAMLWFDTVRRKATPEQIVDISQIAVSLDSNIPPDKVLLDVLRTKKMVMIRESRR